MISKSILIPLFAVLVVYCSHILGHSIRDSDHPLRPIQETLVQAFEKAKLPTTLQYFANKREIGIRYNTKYGPRIATFPGDITVGVLNSELSKNTHLGDNCSLKSNSFATVSEVYPASDALSFDVDLTLQCQVNENTLEHINDSNAVDKYDARTIINYLLRPAMFSEDYIPADIKEKLADYSYLAFHKDCSSPDAPSNCIELQGMRLASKGLDASETPNYYRDAADYLYTSYAGVTNWVREFAEWHKGPLHEFYNYLDPVHAKSHTGIYGLNNGSIITADKSKSLGLSGIRALKLIANAYDTLEPEKAEELVVQIIQTFAPNSVDEIRISMTGDWASGTHESHLVALLLRRETKPHWTFHLGDIYFTGNPSEIEHNILGVVPPNAQKAVTWTHGTLGSFAFPGNHEYYSMGNGFYKNWLPALGTYNEHGAISGQKATYASFENEFWRIIGIDTGYSTFDPIIEAHNTTQPIDVINWMRTTLNLENHKLGIDNRAIIIIGHHQYRSAFATQFLDTPKQLEEFLDLSKPVIWFWGHEHKLSIYHLGKVEDIELMAYGRCIGIGGYPTAHTPIPENARSNGLHAYDDRTWFIQSGDLGTYDQGFNGYASLKIKGLTASIEYRTLKLVKDTDKLDPITSEVVITESFTIEPKTGKIQHTSFEVVNPGIVIIDNIQPAGTDGRDINNGISRSYLEMKSKEKKEKKEKNCTHGDSVGVEDADIDTGNEKTTRHMGKPHLRGEDVEQYYREIIHMEL